MVRLNHHPKGWSPHFAQDAALSCLVYVVEFAAWGGINE